MKKFAIRAVMLGVALLAPSLMQAQVIDQQLTVTDDPTNLARSGNMFGQSFTPLQNNSVGAAAWIFNPTANLVVTSLRVVLLGNDISGNPTLADVLQPFEIAANSGQWVTAYWSAVSLTPSTVNYLEFQTQDGVNTGPLVTAYNGSDAYGGGQAFDTADGTYNGNATFYPADDFLFKEYATNATPEPASLVLLGSGLLGIGAVARRRRQKSA